MAKGNLQNRWWTDRKNTSWGGEGDKEGGRERGGGFGWAGRMVGSGRSWMWSNHNQIISIKMLINKKEIPVEK